MYTMKTSVWLKQIVGKLDEVEIGQILDFFLTVLLFFQVIFSYLGHQSQLQLQKKVMMMTGHLIESYLKLVRSSTLVLKRIALSICFLKRQKTTFFSSCR